MLIHKLKDEDDKKGFTLVELLVVIGIIGILAAIAIPNFIAYKKKAYYAAQSSDAKNAYTSAQSYYNEYPSKDILSVDDLKAYGFKSSSNVTLTIIDGTQESLTIFIDHPESDTTYTLEADGNISPPVKK